jgi:hypothetical protein
MLNCVYANAFLTIALSPSAVGEGRVRGCRYSILFQKNSNYRGELALKYIESL